MQVSNTQYFFNLPFEDYLLMPGISFSGLKDEKIIPTEGMKLGTRCHNYLFEPATYDWQQVEIVKNVSAAIRKYIGGAFKYLLKEVSFTAEFTHNGLTMLFKGRADMLVPGKIVLDLKILAGSLKQAIERFNYGAQVSGYCLATGSAVGIIIAWNKQKKHVEVAVITPEKGFWEYHIIQRGHAQIETN